MNHKTTYELTITEKLQHLPLPDLEDAIWQRVKTQLDLDLPTDDGGGQGPDAPSGSGWTWSVGLFLFVAALVAVFLYLKKPINPSSTINPLQNTTPIATPTPEALAESAQQINTQERRDQRPARPPDPLTEGAPGLTLQSPADSGFHTPAASVLQPPAMDSLQHTTVIAGPSLRTDTAKAKPKKGVGGITDADYRIVPAKKDSL